MLCEIALIMIAGLTLPFNTERFHYCVGVYICELGALLSDTFMIPYFAVIIVPLILVDIYRFICRVIILNFLQDISHIYLSVNFIQ